MVCVNKLSMFQEIIESAPDAMLVVDSGGIIILVNRRVEVMFGYSREDLLGHEVEVLVPKSLRAVHRQQRAHRVVSGHHAFSRDMGVLDGIMARHSDGSVFPVDISQGPLHRDGLVHSVVAVRDLTAKMAGEAARIHLVERLCELEAELDQLKAQNVGCPVCGTVDTGPSPRPAESPARASFGELSSPSCLRPADDRGGDEHSVNE